MANEKRTELYIVRRSGASRTSRLRAPRDSPRSTKACRIMQCRWMGIKFDFPSEPVDAALLPLYARLQLHCRPGGRTNGLLTKALSASSIQVDTEWYIRGRRDATYLQRRKHCARGFGDAARTRTRPSRARPTSARQDVPDPRSLEGCLRECCGQPSTRANRGVDNHSTIDSRAD